MLEKRHLYLEDLRHRWVECLLGAIVIAVVTSTLVLQRSVTASAGERVHELAHELGKNMLVVPADAEASEAYMLRYGDASMPDDYPERIHSSPLGRHIKMVQARLNANVEVQGVSLILVGESGRGDRSPATMSAPPLAELGAEAAGLLNARAGDQIDVRGTSLLITGVRTYPSDGFGMAVFTSLETAQQILDRPGQINSMRLGGCWCKLDVPGLASEVETLLPGTRAITVAGVLKAQKGTVATMERYSLALYLVGLLLVGGTVAALISSQVRRSMREIGLLLAVGASTGTVQGLLVVKAAVLGAAGGLLGYFAGIPLTTALGSRLLELPLEPPSGLWLPTLALCTLVSVAAASLPAWRASHLDPTQLLREE